MIRALRDAPADPWRAEDDAHPLRRLHCTIWHQGTVYDATAHAVPFLIELAADPAVRCRLEVVSFLGEIASADPGGACEEAVARGLAFYLELLAGADVQLRAAGAYVLSSLPGRREVAAAALRGAAAAERDALALAGILLCLGRLGAADPQTIAVLSGVIETSRKRAPRAAAAVGLATLLREKTPHRAARILIGATDADWFDDCFQGLPWDVYAELDLDDLVAAMGPAPASKAVARLLAQLRGPKDDPGFIVQSLIRLAFKPAPHGPPRTLAAPFELTDDQRTVVRAIVGSDEAWTSTCLFMFFLHDVGLPLRRWQLAERIGEPALCPRPSLIDESGRPRTRVGATKLRAGDRVFHEDYGVGTVEHFGKGDVARIAFDLEGSAEFVRDRAVLYRA